MAENVLVIPRVLFDELGPFQGLERDVDRWLPRVLDPGNNLFLARDLAERDPGHKQIIPFAILTHEGRILHYVRGDASGEKRLVAKGSIGIGGHLNEGDRHHLDAAAYRALVLRELHEEVDIDDGFQLRIVALLNDDSNEVGRVHLGIVHVVELATPRVDPRELEITQLELLGLDELHARRSDMETWSRICLDGLGESIVTRSA